MTINLTDPANHPANGPLTAERIECVIEALQRSIQYQNGGDMAYVIADAIKGLEELLVGKEAASSQQPVPDEELDQIIWKLERDGGMTPKLLSLMRELREVRRNYSVTPEGYVLVPKKLTAENGAKGVLLGEFSETKFINCPECFGDDECETCDGSGRIEITVPVTWTTIKAIWSKGVEHFATAAPQEVRL